QGATIPAVSRWLGVAAPLEKRFRYPIEYTPTAGLKSQLVELPVPERSRALSRSLVELALPTGALVVLIRRGDEMFVPNGATRIQERDMLLLMAEQDSLARIRDILNESGPGE